MPPRSSTGSWWSMSEETAVAAVGSPLPLDCAAALRASAAVAGTSGGGGCFRRAVVLAVRARRCHRGGAAVRWSWRPRCGRCAPPCAALAEPAAGGCCHRRRCGQRAPLPHWWRLLPFPRPAFAGAGTVARVSDGPPPSVGAGGRGWCCVSARGRAPVLLGPFCSPVRLPGAAPTSAWASALSGQCRRLVRRPRK
jgi:hypothetical protein